MIAAKTLSVPDPTTLLRRLWTSARRLRHWRKVGKAIIDISTVEDVQQFRSDLSRQQAWRVLQSAEETFDPNLGVVGPVVVQIAQTLYPLSEDRTWKSTRRCTRNWTRLRAAGMHVWGCVRSGKDGGSPPAVFMPGPVHTHRFRDRSADHR